MAIKVVATIFGSSSSGETTSLGNVDAFVLAGAVWSRRKDQIDALVVVVVELDGTSAVLVQTAGVIDGYGLTAAITAGIVVAELSVSCGWDGADESAEKITDLHVIDIEETV
jgi:hypothetical protein